MIFANNITNEWTTTNDMPSVKNAGYRVPIGQYVSVQVVDNESLKSAGNEYPTKPSPLIPLQVPGIRKVKDRNSQYQTEIPGVSLSYNIVAKPDRILLQPRSLLSVRLFSAIPQSHSEPLLQQQWPLLQQRLNRFAYHFLSLQE
jgi:hypothetical protein